MATPDQSVGQRIDPRDSLANGGYRVVDQNVARGPDDFESRYASIFLNSYSYHRGNFGGGRDGTRWLIPLAVKAVVQHFAVGRELGILAHAASLA